MHCKLKSFNISLFCLCVCPALLLCQCCTGMTAKWSRTLCSYQAAPLTAPWRSLWESQSSLFQKTGTRSVKCLQKGEIQVNIFEDKHKSEWLCDHWCLFSFFFSQKWSWVWRCPAVCSSSSSPSSLASSVGRRSQWATGDTTTWSTRKRETNPDRSTNCSPGDLKTSCLGTAAMMMNSKCPAWRF